MVGVLYWAQLSYTGKTPDICDKCLDWPGLVLAWASETQYLRSAFTEGLRCQQFLCTEPKHWKFWRLKTSRGKSTNLQRSYWRKASWTSFKSKGFAEEESGGWDAKVALRLDEKSKCTLEDDSKGWWRLSETSMLISYPLHSYHIFYIHRSFKLARS